MASRAKEICATLKKIENGNQQQFDNAESQEKIIEMLLHREEWGLSAASAARLLSDCLSALQRLATLRREHAFSLRDKKSHLRWIYYNLLRTIKEMVQRSARNAALFLEERGVQLALQELADADANLVVDEDEETDSESEEEIEVHVLKRSSLEGIFWCQTLWASLSIEADDSLVTQQFMDNHFERIVPFFISYFQFCRVPIVRTIGRVDYFRVYLIWYHFK